MFVGHEVLLDASFAAARERLVQLTKRGALTSASEDAYSCGTADLARVGAAGLSKLVRVQLRELAWTDRSAGLAIRWEATGPGGGLFPVLDADLRFASVGDQVTLLTVAGVYRPPLGPLGEALDRVVLHRVADATIGNFASWLAAQVAGLAQRRQRPQIVPGLRRQLSPVLLRLRAAGLCGTGGWSRFGPRSFLA